MQPIFCAISEEDRSRGGFLFKFERSMTRFRSPYEGAHSRWRLRRTGSRRVSRPRRGDVGRDITVYGAGDRLGGAFSLAGDAATGHILPTGAVFDAEFRCTFDLLATIPSARDPAVRADFFATESGCSGRRSWGRCRSTV